MKLVSAADVIEKFESDFNNCVIRYGDLKKQLAEDLVKFIAPVREKASAIQANKAYLSKVIKLGEEKARASAGKTIREVREIIGIRKF